jgi:hypothetical protein
VYPGHKFVLAPPLLFYFLSWFSGNTVCVWEEGLPMAKMGGNQTKAD